MSKIDLIEKLKDNKKLKILVIIGFVGIMLIFLSDFIPKDNDKTKTDTEEEKFSSSEYEKQIEKKLSLILSQIDGTGSLKVMVTIENGRVINYAKQINKTSEQKSDSTNESYEDSIITDENKNAVIESVSEPQIKGVLVVCDGGENITVKTKIIEAVSKVLAVSSAKICVTT